MNMFLNSLILIQFIFVPSVFCGQNFEVQNFENGFGYHKIIFRQMLNDFTYLLLNTTTDSACKYQLKACEPK